MKPYVTSENLEEKTRLWLKRVHPFNTHDMQLNTGKSALLVIDMQQFFLDPQSPTCTEGGTAALPMVKRVLEAFRKVRSTLI
jgi:isochorismate hydrolase